MTGWPVSLQDGDVALRPIRRRDAKAWNAVRVRNRDWLEEWEATAPPGGEPGPRNFAELVRLFNRQARRGQALPWLVWVEEDGWHLAGQVTVSAIVLGSARSATLGYWIDQAWAGRGIIPRAVAMATDHCFGTMGLHRMEIAIRPENTKSLRVVEKLGFRPEGVRPALLHINGAWRDHAIFALNREEVPPGGLLRALRGA